MADLPIICTLPPEGLRDRRDGLLARLMSLSDGHELLADGVRIQFAPNGEETLSTIARVVEAERACCRFLRFSITVEPDGGPTRLEVTGPPGTREFISGLLNA
jgi:hypothetical protein